MVKKNGVTVVIPTKNEGEGLAQILNQVRPYADEVMVIDGHSTDNTRSICEKQRVAYSLDHGKGRGDGVRLGMEKAQYDVVVLFDADGSHESRDIPRFIAPIKSGKADMVIGSRRLGGSYDLNMDFAGILRSGGSDFLAYLVNKRFGTKLSDVLYSFRSVRKSSALKMGLTANDFGIEQEMVVKCLKKGFSLVEIPSREKARGWGQSKLKTVMGVKFIFNLIKELYS